MNELTTIEFLLYKITSNKTALLCKLNEFQKNNIKNDPRIKN